MALVGHVSRRRPQLIIVGHQPSLVHLPPLRHTRVCRHRRLQHLRRRGRRASSIIQIGLRAVGPECGLRRASSVLEIGLQSDAYKRDLPGAHLRLLPPPVERPGAKRGFERQPA